MLLDNLRRALGEFWTCALAALLALTAHAGCFAVPGRSAPRVEISKRVEPPRDPARADPGAEDSSPRSARDLINDRDESGPPPPPTSLPLPRAWRDANNLLQRNDSPATADEVAKFVDTSVLFADGRYATLCVTRNLDAVRSKLYTVQIPGQPPKTVNTTREIATEMASLSRATNTRVVYILMNGPDASRDADSLRLSLKNIHGPYAAHVLPTSDPSSSGSGGDPLPTFFAPVKETALAISLIDSFGVKDDGDGRFEQTVTISRRVFVDSFTLRVVGRTADLVSRFIAILLDAFKRSERKKGVSYAALVLQAKAQLTRDLQLRPEELDRDLKINIGATQVADNEREDAQLRELLRWPAGKRL